MEELATIDQLREAVEATHHCHAIFRETVHVAEKHKGKPVWEGDVSVFDVEGIEGATTAYAWADPVAASKKRIRFFAVLGKPPVTNANQAVQAAIVARYRNEISR